MVITIKNGWNTIACTKTIHLEQHPHQQQSLKILLILQGHKNSHRKILATGILSQIWNYYILEVWEKDCHLKKRCRRMCDNLKNFAIVYNQYSFEFSPFVASHISTNFVYATYRYNWKEL